MRAELEHSEIWLHQVHSADSCAGGPCAIHNRTDHAMRRYPQHWREDLHIIERICRHGVGHPDPDMPYPPGSPERVHGCDGCCTKETAQ